MSDIPAWLQVLALVITVGVIPPLWLMVRILAAMQKMVDAHNHTLYGPTGTDGLYRDVRDVEDRVSLLEQRQ